MLQIDTRKYSVHVGSGKIDGVTSPERFAQFTCDSAEAAFHQMEWMNDQRLMPARIGCGYGDGFTAWADVIDVDGRQWRFR